MKVKQYKALVVYVFLMALPYRMISMESAVVEDRHVLQEFEVGTKMGGMATRIFCLDTYQINTLDLHGLINARDMHDIINVALSQVDSDEQECVIVKAEEHIIDQLQVSIVNKHILSLQPKTTSVIQPRKKIVYCVALKNIAHLLCTGSVKVVSLTPIHNNELQLMLQGKSTFSADGPYGIDTNVLNITLKDASCVSLAGNARHQKICLSDSAEYNAQHVKTNTLCIDARGASTMNVRMADVSSEDTIHFSGMSGVMRDSSILHYTGNSCAQVKCHDTSQVQKQLTQK